jgi:hypothetical protein
MSRRRRRHRTRLLAPRRVEPAPTAIAVEAPPEGTVSEVLAWVGDDAGRAQQALEAEQAGKQRATLISELQRLAGA